jgi:hypothetical protein
MHLAAEIKLLRDALGGHHRASLEMQVEAGIVSLRDALGRRDRASLEMHLKAEIKLNSEMQLQAGME